MNKLWQKFKLRKQIIAKIKRKDLSAVSLRQYIRYIALYDSNVVDEFAVYCSINKITGVHNLIIDGRKDINLELSVLGETIFVKVYSKDGEHSTIAKEFGFTGNMDYDSLVDTPLTDYHLTIDGVTSIIANSILYTIENHTKSWWKNEKSLRDDFK